MAFLDALTAGPAQGVREHSPRSPGSSEVRHGLCFFIVPGSLMRQNSGVARSREVPMHTTRRHFLSASAATAAAVPAAARAAPRAERWMPKLSENLADVNPETLRWLKQLGCKH